MNTNKIFIISLFSGLILVPNFCKPHDSNKTTDSLPTVAIVTTGGTIASKIDPKTGGVVPVLSGNDLIQTIPGLAKIAKIKIFEFSSIDSSRMTPEIWGNLSKLVDDILKDDEITGAVVTHGTDTMAEGAYFLDLTLQSNKPVVFVGAMRDASSLSPDGPENIYNAISQVVCQEAKNFGVTVTLNQYINSAKDVRKTETTNVQSFDSGNKGYLGYIEAGKVYKFHDKPASIKIPLPKDQVTKGQETKDQVTKGQETNVHETKLPKVVLIKTFEGDDGSFVRHATEDGARGIVIEGAGSGNVNENVYEAIKYALSKNVFVVISTRVPNGGVYPIYGGSGGGHELQKLGAIFSGDLASSKARLLLMLAIAQSSDPKDVAKYF